MGTRVGPTGERRDSSRELTALERQVADLTATLAAIRTGGVDAVLVGGPGREQLYTLVNADRPYRVIIEDMGESAFTVSSRGVMLFANRAMRDLCGARGGRDLMGTAVADLVPVEQQPRLQALLDVTPGETKRGELSLRCGDGSVVPALVSVTGVDLDETVVRCVVAADLTEVKAAERDLAITHAELVRHDRALQVSNAALQRSNEELLQFAHIVSHDLSEPLRTIIGFADMLRERYAGRLDSDADEFLDFIISGATRLQSLIDDLLTYSRVETRVRPFAPVDLNTLLGTVLADLQVRIDEREGQVALDPLPTVLGDDAQLAQVFSNLVKNALTFVADGVRPEIHVSAERGDRCWRLTVADNGIGIPEEYRDRVFKIFQRLHGRDEFPGTGVGLAVVEKVVHRHGGRVTIEDNPGGGTLVHFTLPDEPPSARQEEP